MSEQVQHIPLSAKQSSQRYTYDEMEAAYGLLMLSQSFTQQVVSAFHGLADEELVIAVRIPQQMASVGDHTVSVRSDDARNNSVQSNCSVRPTQPQLHAEPEEMDVDSVDQDPDFVPQPLAEPKHGKKSKMAGSKRKRAVPRKIATADVEEDDGWQPPIPPDDEDDEDYKPPAHLRLSKTARVGPTHRSARLRAINDVGQDTPMVEDEDGQASPFHTPSPELTNLPESSLSSRGPKSNKALNLDTT